MTRDRRGLGQAGAAALAVFVLAGCSADDPGAAPAAASPSPASGTSPAAPPSEPTTSASASGAPTPGRLSIPATSSGPLSQDSFPTPEDLGVPWRYAVDPGDAEEGYLGNGTPALERDPAEVVAAAVPFGCTRPHRMPTPDHALEVDYAYGDVKVIAVRSSFADAPQARSFFRARADNLRACTGRSGGEAMGPLVTRTWPAARGVLLSDRTPESDPWGELAIVDGDAVVLVAAQARPDAPPLTDADVRDLARTFRS